MLRSNMGVIFKHKLRQNAWPQAVLRSALHCLASMHLEGRARSSVHFTQLNQMVPDQ